MKADGLFRLRLHHQRITGPPFATAAEAVRALGAVQSQDYPGAKWSLGQRVAGATDAALDAAFTRGEFLRTHVLRPTWHFVAPEDIRWMLALTAPHVRRTMASYDRRLGLDRKLYARTHTLFAKALEGGGSLTRAELKALLAKHRITTDVQRLAHIMMDAELEGLVCSGPLRGKQHTYALIDERVPAARPMPRDEALGRLALRFFEGHAPATLRHFMWWSHLRVADARSALDAVRSALEMTVIDGAEWFGGTDRPHPAPRTAHLLPEYDEALVGSKDMPGVDLPRRYRWDQGWYKPLIIGGRRAGTWQRREGRGGVVVALSLFAQLNPKQRAAVRRAADRFAAFLDTPVTLA